jgi:hypothetical protein
VSIRCRHFWFDVILKASRYRQTAIYASGVGLGASKGKEVGKYQEGYTGYVNMVKDSVSHYPHILSLTTLIANTFVL